MSRDVQENENGEATGQQDTARPSVDEMLVLLNRVVAAAVTSIVVTDPSLPDNPIVYHNPAFERISGYRPDEIDGRNCRFLQGPETDPKAVNDLRDAIRLGRDSRTQFLNYRKDGTPFWNELFISPVHDVDGTVTHFVGVQNDVTRRAEAEQERADLLAQQKRIVDTLQRALLLTPPADALPGIEISTQYVPAWAEAQFGGDFYDSFALDDGKIALIVGDLTGKGLQAAQNTAEVKFALRVLLREYRHPTPALHRLNMFLLESQRLDARDSDALVCVTVAVVDTATGEAHVASAGMEPPLVLRSDGKPEALEYGGMLLGMDALARYRAETVRLGRGDVLILATDGVTEARMQKQFFGYDGLVDAAQAARAKSPTPKPKEISAQIVEKAKEFAGGKLQDDVCVLVARLTAKTTTTSAPKPPGESSRDTSEGGELARFALEVTGLGYWELDTATGTTRRSPRHDQIFGYVLPPTTWTYAQFLNHVHPDDRADVDARYGHALVAGQEWNVTCRIIRADGQLAWIESRGRHFSNGDGTAPRIIGTVRDITEQKDTEAREQFLNDLAARTRFELDPDAVLWETVRAVGKFLCLDRFMYADIDQDAEQVSVGRDYRAPGVPSVAGVWPFAPWKPLLGDFRAGRTVVNTGDETDAGAADSWQIIYEQTGIRASITVPLFRNGKWVAVFSAQSQNRRAWVGDDVTLLETVARQMWLILENARLYQSERGQAARQRGFLRDMLFSLTEGKLGLCLAPSELPAPLPRVSAPVPLSRRSLHQLRKQVERVAEQLHLPKERVQDVETSVGEAAMNAVVHGNGGEGWVCADAQAGVMQVWVRDVGGGIDEAALPRALEKGASSVGTLGHGFWLMLKTCDRIYLLTSASGTTVVLEQERTPPRLPWFEAFA